MVDFSDSKTYWLNITNIGLGLVTLACLLIATRAFLRDVLERLFPSRAASEDARLFVVPGLGTTMADGGEPLPENPDTRKNSEDPR